MRRTKEQALDEATERGDRVAFHVLEHARAALDELDRELGSPVRFSCAALIVELVAEDAIRRSEYPHDDGGRAVLETMILAAAGDGIRNARQGSATDRGAMRRDRGKG